MTQMIRWEPFGELSRMRREMDDLWSRMAGEGTHAEERLADWMPALDVSETDGELHVRAELPGLEVEDIDVSVSGDMLTLRGEKKTEHKEENENFYARESYSGMFQRTVRLPSEVEAEAVEANFKNGVLSIKMPKSEKSERKKIEVKSA